jgi:cytosine permease
MANVPSYITSTQPNPAGNRAAWFKNIAPTYAGIFLWIGFYDQLAGSTIANMGLGTAFLALIVGGLLSYIMFYHVPGMLGMKTGLPLYIVGSSTFGAKGGYLMPGLLMGVLQIGWLGVNAALVSTFLLMGLGMDSAPGSVAFWIISGVWSFGAVYVALKGIQYVAAVATYLNWVPLILLAWVAFANIGGVAKFTPPEAAIDGVGFLLAIQFVAGFVSTAGVAGTDFGMNSRDSGDVVKGGLVGIPISIIIAGGLALTAVAGAIGNGATGMTFGDAVQSVGGVLGSAMFFLFVAASAAPACFSSFIAANSFTTMLPSLPRGPMMIVAAAIAFILAATGVAMNLIVIFTFIGASFGPIAGAMAADYLLSGKKWAGPREGINFAGYGAWAAGFIVGIGGNIGLNIPQPAVIWSIVVGFVVYIILAKVGLEPKKLEIGAAPAPAAPEQPEQPAAE